MTAIDDKVAALIQREGGYSDNPADKGGPTNFGITEHVARAYGYAGDMRSLPYTIASSIYRIQYWTAPSFAQVNLVYDKVASELFDTGVNMGPSVASTFLQRALNVLNRGATDYPDINEDGKIGRMTLYSLEQYRVKRSNEGEVVLIELLNDYQGCRYSDIAKANPKDEGFMFGWIANRVANRNV
jgi:lysozyme family protein